MPHHMRGWWARALQRSAGHEYASRARFDSVLCAPLKSELRASEKMHDEYGGRPPPYASYLLDILRGTLICDSEDEIVKCVDYLRTHATVLRLKNRFREPHFSGMRDCLLNCEVDGLARQRLPPIDAEDVQCPLP